MKNYFIPILVFFAFIWVLKGINSGSSKQKYKETTNVTVNVDSQAKDGLDLKALIELIKNGKSAEDIEKKLNQKQGINNLDLDEDGKVDFIKVTEYGDKKSAYGFSFTVEVKGEEEQEIAEIEIEKEGENANIVARGNEQVYGHNHHYHSHFPVTSFLLWSYLLTPHSFYYSPWRFGYYPSYYSYYSPVNRGVYRSRVGNIANNSSTKRISSNSPKSKSKLSNPNRGKTANSGIKKSLAKPTQTQKKFQARTRTKKVGAGGFGRKKSNFSSNRTKTSSPRTYSARGFSSGRGFGGGGK